MGKKITFSFFILLLTFVLLNFWYLFVYRMIFFLGNRWIFRPVIHLHWIQSPIVQHLHLPGTYRNQVDHQMVRRIFFIYIYSIFWHLSRASEIVFLNRIWFKNIFLLLFFFFITGATNNQPTQNPLSMQFCTNGRLNENSFKISLKPQNTLKQPQVAQSQTPTPVTSTNPKTPSPSTNDVRLVKYCGWGV